LLEITAIPIREFYLDPNAGISVYRDGRPKLRELFGAQMELPKLSTPPISYGHANSLGIELLFPDKGEVNYERAETSLQDYVRILSERRDLTTTGMVPFYLEYRERLESAFPGEKVSFGFKHEGPLTTAYVLRNEKVFVDPFDDPKTFGMFLEKLTGSISNFASFAAEINGSSGQSPRNVGIADDVAGLFGPALWPEFVLPYVEQFFRSMRADTRKAHIEGLHPEHLPLLEHLMLEYFDPSISPLLNPSIIRKRCRVPFGWRLANFHYSFLTADEIADWVYQAAGHGASRIFTFVCAGMINQVSVEKVNSFAAASRRVEEFLARGGSRTEISRWVSEDGRKRFWDHWPEV
jgi:hypothetical protein